MRGLDKNVVYTTEGVSREKIEELYYWLLKNDKGWEDYDVSEIVESELEYDGIAKQWYIYGLKGGATSINTLFEVGGKDSLVLVSNNLVDWSVEEIVLEHKGLYYCDKDGVLEPYNYIMELTEEQKQYLNK